MPRRSAAGKRHGYRLALVEALILILALGAAGFLARETPLMQALFGGTKEVRDLASEPTSIPTVKPDKAPNPDAVGLKLGGAVYDGARIALSWTVRSEFDQAVFYIADTPTLDGEPVGANMVGMPLLLGSDGALRYGGEYEENMILRDLSPQQLGKPHKLHTTARFFTAGAPLLAGPAADAVLPVSRDIKDGLMILSSPNLGYLVDTYDGIDGIDELIRLGYLIPLKEIPIDVDLEPIDSELLKAKKLAGQSKFEFAGYTLTVRQIKYTFDPSLGGTLDAQISITPKATYDGSSSRRYAVLNAEGETLPGDAGPGNEGDYSKDGTIDYFTSVPIVGPRRMNCCSCPARLTPRIGMATRPPLRKKRCASTSNNRINRSHSPVAGACGRDFVGRGNHEPDEVLSCRCAGLALSLSAAFAEAPIH